MLPVEFTGFYSFNTSIISNGHYARKVQFLDCKNFLKSFKTKPKEASVSKINNIKNLGKYCKRMLGEKYTKNPTSNRKVWKMS